MHASDAAGERQSRPGRRADTCGRGSAWKRCKAWRPKAASTRRIASQTCDAHTSYCELAESGIDNQSLRPQSAADAPPHLAGTAGAEQWAWGPGRSREPWRPAEHGMRGSSLLSTPDPTSALRQAQPSEACTAPGSPGRAAPRPRPPSRPAPGRSACARHSRTPPAAPAPR